MSTRVVEVSLPQGTPVRRPAFEARQLRFRYPAAPFVAIEDVTVSIWPGELYAVIGPNGSGKSTFLRLLLGALRPAAGEIVYEGRPIGAWSRRALARSIGVVPQSEELAFPLTVRELVAMGRYPHLGVLRPERPADRQAMAEAMARCEVLELADRPLVTLSGGERQRARMARALAQEPRTLVLDEPTISLDIRHEMTIFALLQELARERVTIVVVTHNINLAARYARRLLLLDHGHVAAEGGPDEVLRGEVLERVYRWPVTVHRHPGPGPDRGAPQVVPLASESDLTTYSRSSVRRDSP